MKKEIVNQIKRLQGNAPIPCSEYLDILKPEYTVFAGYEEPYSSENESYDGHYFVNIVEIRLETDKEYAIRREEETQQARMRNLRTLEGATEDSIFLYKHYSNGKLAYTYLLKLWKYDIKSDEVCFIRQNDKSVMVTNLRVLHRHKWESAPGVVKVSCIQLIK